MNSLASDFGTNSSTGRLKQDSLIHDSIFISYDDLRKVNSRLIELEYEKDINEHLRTIIVNDSIAIDGFKLRIYNDKQDYNIRMERIKKQRNIAEGVGIGAIILLIISIL